MKKLKKKKAKPVTKSQTRPPIPKPDPMTSEEFRDALAQLDLTAAAVKTAVALGLGTRQCQRFANDEAPVPEPVAKLLRMYIEHGIPDDSDES